MAWRNPDGGITMAPEKRKALEADPVWWPKLQRLVDIPDISVPSDEESTKRNRDCIESYMKKHNLPTHDAALRKLFPRYGRMRDAQEHAEREAEAQAAAKGAPCLEAQPTAAVITKASPCKAAAATPANAPAAAAALSAPFALDGQQQQQQQQREQERPQQQATTHSNGEASRQGDGHANGQAQRQLGACGRAAIRAAD